MTQRVRQGMIVHAVAGFLVVAALAVTLALHLSSADAEPPAHRPIAVHSDGYVSSDQCRSCHPSEYASWQRSYHHTMTQVASREAVFAKFQGTTLNLDGRRFELQQHDDKFFVRMTAPQGVAADPDGLVTLPITLVTGSHHMQVFWFETGYHRLLGQLPAVFLEPEQRWIPRASAFLAPAPIHSMEMGRWNQICLNCHTTHGQPRPNAQGELDTHVAEMGIACEACHGPAQAHVERQRSPLQRYAEHFQLTKTPEIVQPEKLGAHPGSEVCSQCHGAWQMSDPAAIARWTQHGHAYRPGKPHVDQWLFQPSRTENLTKDDKHMRKLPDFVDGQFWSDGMARVSGREYNGMVDSPCYADQKLSCFSCHTMHKRQDDPHDPRSLDTWADDQLGAGMDGNQACLQCHAKIGEQLSQHTFHAAGSSGSQCYNCHMPHTSYGLLKAIRTHKVTSPDVSATLATGRPNACNLCHLDKSLGWTAARLSERYGIAAPVLDQDQREQSAALLWALRGDAGQRALIAWSLGWKTAQAVSGTDWMAPVLGPLTDDPYDAVRMVASRALRNLPDWDKFAYDAVPQPNSRAPVAAAILSRWRTLHPNAPLDGKLFARLLEQRDNRTIQLLE